MSRDQKPSRNLAARARAFDLAPLYLAVSSQKTGKFLEVNDAFIEATGYSRDEAIGKSSIELGLWADTEARAAGLEELRRHGHIHEREVQLRLKSGEARHFLISAEVIELDGEPCIINAALDITRRVEAERQSRESDERYRTLFNATDEGFCVVEVLFDANTKAVDYRFLETNPRFEDQTGLRDALGRTARELVPKLEAHWFDSYGKVALTGEATRFENGSEEMGRWFDVYAFRVGGEESRKVGILFKDITERKRTELALQASTAALADLNQALETRVKERTRQVQDLATQLTLAEAKERSRLAQVLHDELQQELYAAQFALAQVLNVAQAGGDVTQEAAKVSDQIKKALRVARSTTTNLSPPSLVSEHLSEALDWLVSDMYDRYQLTVTLDLPYDLSVPNEALRVLLFNLVRELLFNVVKHAGVQAASVTLAEEEDQLLLVVKDTGIGFDLAGLKDTSGGTGLGLSGARKRLTLFGGHLNVDSAAGEGTRVTVVVPAQPLSPA